MVQANCHKFLLTDDVHCAVELVPGVLDDAQLLEVDVDKGGVGLYLG